MTAHSALLLKITAKNVFFFGITVMVVFAPIPPHLYQNGRKLISITLITELGTQDR
jgi:hypothetical protein